MSYVIYHIESTRFLQAYAKKGKTRTLYGTERAAKSALTRAIKENPELLKSDFSIADNVDFNNGIEKFEIRKGIIHSEGKEFNVRVNTPWQSGPWSETYHCS